MYSKSCSSWSNSAQELVKQCPASYSKSGGSLSRPPGATEQLRNQTANKMLLITSSTGPNPQRRDRNMPKSREASLFNHFAHLFGVLLLVCLCAQGPNRRALGTIQDTLLKVCLVGHSANLTTKGIHLTDTDCQLQLVAFLSGTFGATCSSALA